MRRTVPTVAVIVLIVIRVAVASEKAAPVKSAKNFLGKERLAIVQNADRVETYRLKVSLLETKQDKDAKRIAGRVLIGQGKDFARHQVATLKRVISADSSYAWEKQKECEPEPGVVFRVYQGRRYVDVILCFSCDMWGFHLSKKNGGRNPWEDFDPIRHQLVALAKASFPEDTAIQKLK